MAALDLQFCVSTWQVSGSTCSIDALALYWKQPRKRCRAMLCCCPGAAGLGINHVQPYFLNVPTPPARGTDAVAGGAWLGVTKVAAAAGRGAALFVSADLGRWWCSLPAPGRALLNWGTLGLPAMRHRCGFCLAVPRNCFTNFVYTCINASVLFCWSFLIYFTHPPPPPPVLFRGPTAGVKWLWWTIWWTYM